MEDEETEAKIRFYDSLTELLNLINERIEHNEPWIYVYIKKEEEKEGE